MNVCLYLLQIRFQWASQSSFIHMMCQTGHEFIELGVLAQVLLYHVTKWKRGQNCREVQRHTVTTLLASASAFDHNGKPTKQHESVFSHPVYIHCHRFQTPIPQRPPIHHPFLAEICFFFSSLTGREATS